MKCSSCGFEIHRDEPRAFMGETTRHKVQDRCVELLRAALEAEVAESGRLHEELKRLKECCPVCGLRN